MKKEVADSQNLNKELLDNESLLNDDVDDDILKLISDNLNVLENQISSLETSVILNGEFDQNDCYLEIHPGAGGTESCDWEK